MTVRLWHRWYPYVRTVVLAGLVGWLLADFQVPSWVTLISLGLMAHLSWAGGDAIFLSLVWLTGLLWVGVIQFAWPMSLKPDVRLYRMIAWTLNLGVTWLITLTFMVSVAANQKNLIQHGCDRKSASQILVILTWFGFAIGWMINQSQLVSLRFNTN